MEIWRLVVGSTEHQVSSQGQVEVLARTVRFGPGLKAQKRLPERILKQYVRPSGYRSVSIAGRPRLVHHLVLEAFVGPRPSPKAETRHLNGDPGDNRPENLAWGDRLANAADKRGHGTHNNARRQTCRRRGHALVEPNLTGSSTANARWCKACHWGFNTMVTQRKQGRHFDRDVLADMLYAHFMEGVADPRGDHTRWDAARLAAPMEAEEVEGRVRSRTPGAQARLLALVAANEVFTPRDLRQRAEAAGVATPETTLQMVLQRACASGRAERVTRGRYRLVTSRNVE